jgi:hypothetical protein
MNSRRSLLTLALVCGVVAALACVALALWGAPASAPYVPAPSTSFPVPVTGATEAPASELTSPPPTHKPIVAPEGTSTPVSETGVDLGALIAQQINSLATGRLAYNPPSEMVLGETVRVAARIDKDAAGTTDITSTMPGTSQPTVEPIKVGTFMKARLSGDGFDIRPLSNEEQLVAGDTFTEWSWDVTPRVGGEHKLSLLVTVRLNVPGMGEEQRDYPVKDSAVNVRVTPAYAIRQFTQTYWPLLALIVLVPVGALAYRALRTSQRRRGLSGDDATLPPELAELHRKLYTHFSTDELQTLCLSLGVSPDRLGGDNSEAKARNLLLYAHRRSAIGQLIEAVKHQRPDVDWDRDGLPSDGHSSRDGA